MSTKLFLLKEGDVPTKYDCADGFVVRAVDDVQARFLASRQSGDEGVDYWLDPKRSTCVEIEPMGEPMVVLRSFNAG